jgi:hypothetical protein
VKGYGEKTTALALSKNVELLCGQKGRGVGKEFLLAYKQTPKNFFSAIDYL